MSDPAILRTVMCRRLRNSALFASKWAGCRLSPEENSLERKSDSTHAKTAVVRGYKESPERIFRLQLRAFD